MSQPLTLLILLFLMAVGCDRDSERAQRVELTPEQRKLDEQQLSVAIGDCLRRHLPQFVNANMSVPVAAKHLRHVCEVPFAALRQAKLGYIDVPDIQNPPPLVVAEEEAICEQMVRKFRQSQRETLRERFHKFPPPNLMPSPQDKPSDIPRDAGPLIDTQHLNLRAI